MVQVNINGQLFIYHNLTILIYLNNFNKINNNILSINFNMLNLIRMVKHLYMDVLELVLIVDI